MISNVQYRALQNHRYVAVLDKKIIATAFVNDSGNYIQSLVVARPFRRKGIATGLVRFIGEHRGRKLNRCPDRMKNDAVRALSAKLGDELLDEYMSDLR